MHMLPALLMYWWLPFSAIWLMREVGLRIDKESLGVFGSVEKISACLLFLNTGFDSAAMFRVSDRLGRGDSEGGRSDCCPAKLYYTRSGLMSF